MQDSISTTAKEKFNADTLNMAFDLIRNFQHQINLFWELKHVNLSRSVKITNDRRFFQTPKESAIDVFISHVIRRKVFIKTNSDKNFRFGKEVRILTNACKNSAE